MKLIGELNPLQPRAPQSAIEYWPSSQTHTRPSEPPGVVCSDPSMTEISAMVQTLLWSMRPTPPSEYKLWESISGKSTVLQCGAQTATQNQRADCWFKKKNKGITQAAVCGAKMEQEDSFGFLGSHHHREPTVGLSPARTSEVPSDRSSVIAGSRGVCTELKGR